MAFENSLTTSLLLVVFDALGLALDPQVGAAVALLAEGGQRAGRGGERDELIAFRGLRVTTALPAFMHQRAAREHHVAGQGARSA